MGKNLRVLNIEDSERDSMLLAHHLKSAGYDLTVVRVDTSAGMIAALDEAEFDIIICDYSMPRFSALLALDLLRGTGFDVPFIIISGTVGEDTAVQAMLTGAHDYIQKGNLTRLVPAIERELHQARNRREQKKIKDERRAIFEIIQGSISSPTLDEYLDLVHRSVSRIIYAENFIVMLHDRATDVFEFAFWADKSDTQPPPRPVGHGFGSYVLKTGRPLLLTKELKKELVDRGEAILSGTPSKSWIGVPLRTPTRTIGVIVVQHYETENAYSQRDLEFLSSVADQIALAIERKRAEDAIAESEGRYRDLVENAIDIIYTADLTGMITSTNSAGRNVTGYTDEEAMALNMSELLAPEYVDIAKMMMARTIAGEAVPVYEIEIIAKDGDRIPLELNTTIIYENGVPTGLQGIARDITERRVAEAALEESEASFRSLFDTANDAILVLNEGRFLACNPAAETMYRCTKEELIGSSPNKFAPLEQPNGRLSAEMAGEFIEAAMNGAPQNFEWKHNRLDGTLFDAEVSLNRVEYGGKMQLQATVRDITERKQAEATLALLGHTIRSIGECVSVTDIENKIIFVNEAFSSTYGYIPDELMGKSIGIVRPQRSISDDDGILKATVQGSWHGEVINRKKDGTEFPVTLTTSVVRNENGETVALVGIAVDITARKLSEEALQEKTAFLEAQVNSTIDGILVIDEAGNQIIQNEQFVNIFKIPAEIANEPDDTKRLKWVTGRIKDPKQFAEKVAHLYSHPDEISRDEIELTDGTILDRYSAPVIGIDDKNYGRIWTFRDITEQKKADDALREGERILRESQRIAGLGSYVLDTATGTWKSSEVLDKLFGINKGFKRSTEGWLNLIHPDDREMMRDYLKTEVLEKEQAFDKEYRIIRQDNQAERWVHGLGKLELNAQSHLLKLQGTIQDITESRRTGDALRESNEKFEQLAENIKDAFWVRSLDMREVYYVSPAFETIWGRSVASLYADPHKWTDFILPEDQADVHAAFEGLTKDSIDLDIEYRIVRPDGEIRWVRLRGFPVKDAAGAVIRYAGIVTDVTERNRADEMLRSSEANLARSQEIAHLGSWAMDIPETGDVNEGGLHWSDEVYRIFGYEPKGLEVSNEIFFNAVHPEDRADVKAAMAKALENGSDYQIDHRIIRPDASVRFVREHSEIVRNERGVIVKMVGTIQDITRESQLSEQLRQSQKMEAVGVLAGGIAHDFNNLLTAINGYSSLTLKKMGQDDPLRNNIEEVKRAGDRAAELTGQLLAFGRKQVLNPVVLSLNTVIFDIEKMLRRVITESVDLRVISDKVLGNVKADPGQIEQVIMNLAVNARDAMPNGGTLTLETQNVYLDETYVSEHNDVTPGDFIRLTITDTGEGMDERTKEHIFEPFYTTKGVGKGTGLGLSIVYGIVKQSGGDILVYSELGHGTSFKIYLPCVDESVHKPKRIGDHEELYLGTETVLLVEDEAVVRNLVREILTENGYKVLEADGGEAAVAICKSYDEPIDLLLTDVIMPKMGGGELKDLVTKMRPDVLVLFMSGYTDDAVAHRGINHAKTAFIEKPFSPDDLARKVREVFESRHTGTFLPADMAT